MSSIGEVAGRSSSISRPNYDAFVNGMADAQTRLPVDILGDCVMPNHFHVVIRTHADGDLGRWVRSGSSWPTPGNEPLSPGDLQRLRLSAERGQPAARSLGRWRRPDNCEITGLIARG
jgi:hypothetical protein